MQSSLEVAQQCAGAADSKKAFDILILDMRRLTYITDYFVLCSGSNLPQLDAISDAIGHALAGFGIRPDHVEGGPEATWLLLDYGDVVVHVFEEQARAFYALEKLWSDAPRIPLAAPTLPSMSAPA